MTTKEMYSLTVVLLISAIAFLAFPPPSNALEYWSTNIGQEARGNNSSPLPPEGWKKVEATGLFTFYAPVDLKPARIIGEHRGTSIALSNASISYLSFNYASGACELPRVIAEESAYERSTIGVQGKTGVLTIDRSNMPKSIIARACFLNPVEPGARLYIVAICNSDRGLDLWKRILLTLDFTPSAA